MDHRMPTLIISIQLGWVEGFADLAVAAFFVDDGVLDIGAEENVRALTFEDQLAEEVMSVEDRRIWAIRR